MFLINVPDAAKHCKSCAECVIFVLAQERARCQSKKSAGSPKSHSTKGTSKALLVRRLTNEFSSIGEDTLWQDVIDGLCKGGVVENLTANLSNVQPQYVLSASVGFGPSKSVHRHAVAPTERMNPKKETRKGAKKSAKPLKNRRRKS